MENNNFSVPYPIGTYLVKIENGQKHLDRVERYVISQFGIFAVLMLDVDKEPKYSTNISIAELVDNWMVDNQIYLSGDIGTKILIDVPDDEFHLTYDKETKLLVDVPCEKFHLSGNIGTKIEINYPEDDLKLILKK